MTWVSEWNLVAAISNGGGFGVVASGSMSPDQLRSEIAATFDRTNKPFGVNLIVMHPELDALIDGDTENGSMMAGQSVGMVVREQPTAEILDELVDQAMSSLAGEEWRTAAQ